MGVSPAVVESMTKGQLMCVCEEKRGLRRRERGVFGTVTYDWLDSSDTDHSRIRLPI